MTDVITVTDTVAVADPVTETVEVGYIAQTVSSSGGTMASTVTDETTYGVTKAVGTSTASAREDHTHGSPSLGVSGTTAAAGNDTRIVGAAQKAANLSDLASAATARTNLGTPPSTRLVTAGTGLSGGGDLTADRTLAVAYGSAAATAAQGNDSRMADARPYPLSGYGLLAASADPMMIQGTSGVGGNTIWATRVFIPAGVVITNVWVAVRTPGTWDAVTTPNQLGLYDDTGTKLDNTADNGALWTSAGWRGGALVGGVQAAQAAGRFVYVLALVRGITSLALAFPSSPNDANAPFASTGPAGGNRRAMYITTTALPASFAPTSYGTSTGYLALVGIS